MIDEDPLIAGITGAVMRERVVVDVQPIQVATCGVANRLDALGDVSRRVGVGHLEAVVINLHVIATD